MIIVLIYIDFHAVFLQMNALFSTTSVIAIIQLTASVVKLCESYIQEMKDARDEIFSLQQSIVSLQETLEDLQKILQSDDEKTLSIFSRLVSNITDCHFYLRVLEVRLDSEKRKKLMRKVRFRALKWLLKRTEMKSVTQNLEKYKSLFILFLQMNQRYVYRAQLYNSV